MGFATIQTAFNSADAHMIRSRLEVAGFHPFIKGEDAVLSIDGNALAAGGIRIQVPEEEAVEAKRFIEESIGEDTPSES